MKYIRATPNPSGAYPAPQSNPFPGAITLTDEQVATLIQYNGFVSITGEGESVTVEPNTEAWEAWKASLHTTPEPEPDPTPTVAERVDALEAENKLLTAQIEAQSDQLDFYEDCIAEMANIVYA